MTRPRSGKQPARRKSPRCHACGKPVRVPKGWSQGPAVRRHYWAHHRDVMQRNSRGTR